jgi:hypothetical protein
VIFVMASMRLEVALGFAMMAPQTSEEERTGVNFFVCGFGGVEDAAPCGLARDGVEGAGGFKKRRAYGAAVHVYSKNVDSAGVFVFPVL